MHKTTENLSIKYLYARYSVGYHGPEEFFEALKDGTIEAQIKECADAMYGGNAKPVIDQLIKNCQDYLCRARAREMTNTSLANKDKMVDAYHEFLQGYKAAHFAVHAGGAGGQKTVRYNLTIDEINALTDATIAQHVYDCISSRMTKLASGTTVEALDESARKEYLELKAKRTAALHRKNLLKKKAAPTANDVSDKLADKLNKPGKTTLSAAEVEELRKLLGF